MALYDVHRADGSVTRVEATSKSKASAKVRYAGEAIKKVVEVKEGTPTTTPTTPTTTTPTAAEPTTKPATGPAPQGTPQGAIPGPAQGHDWDEWVEYEAYLQFLQTSAGGNFQVPRDIADYYTNKKRWERDVQQGNLPTTPRTSDESFWVEGQLNISRQILSPNNPWLTPEGEPVKLITPEGEPIPTEEYALSPEEAARRREEAYARREEAYEHALSPEEAARRRAERYEREQVAAGEAYHETPRYSQMFSGWMGEQGEFSGALRGYIEKQYPSLRGQYEAGLPQETGYATPTEARAAAAEREAGFAGWLGEQVPEVYQQYMGQRPSERGERLHVQAPTMRTVNW